MSPAQSQVRERIISKVRSHSGIHANTCVHRNRHARENAIDAVRLTLFVDDMCLNKVFCSLSTFFHIKIMRSTIVRFDYITHNTLAA